MSAGIKVVSARVVLGARDLVVELAIKNASMSRTYHVWSSAERVLYDAKSRTLRLEYAARLPSGKGPARSGWHPRVPAQREVRPGGTLTIEASVPHTLRRLEAGARLGTPLVEQTIEGIDHVDVVICYAPTPYEPRRGRSIAQSFAELTSWGTRLEALVPVTADKTAGA